MDISPNLSDAEANRALLEENNRLLRIIQVDTEKTRRYIAWAHVWSLLKLAIIVVPLILGFLYLKPYLDGLFSTYSDLLGIDRSSSEQPSQADLLQQLRSGQIDLNSMDLDQLEQLMNNN